MKIKYCNNSKFEEDTENNIVSGARHMVDSILDNTDCIHNNIELSICIDGPLDNDIKGNIFCNDCQREIITFKGNQSEPMKDITY